MAGTSTHLPHTDHTGFNRGLLLGFVTFACLFAVLNYLHRAPFNDIKAESNLDLSTAAGLPESWIDQSAATFDEAKERKLFWVSAFHQRNRKGFALRVLDNPELFAEVFPGYGDSIQDAHLWDRYFEYPQNSYFLLSPSLSAEKPRLLSHSWVGSFELFERYGADVIIFGNSETYRSMIPAVLSRDLASEFQKDPKVMISGLGGMREETIQLSSRNMARSGKKAEWAVVGYSLWYAFKRHYPDRGEDVKRAAYLKYLSMNDWMSFSLSQFIPPFTWNDIVPLNKPLPAAGTVSKAKPWDEFPAEAANDVQALEALIANKRPPIGLAGIRPEDCNLNAASRALDQTLVELSQVSNKILLFITPTTPLQPLVAPPCFVDSVRKMLVSKVSDRIVVHTGDLRSFDLDYRDFAHASETEGRAYIDPNHTNYRGALKVTRMISNIISRANANRVPAAGAEGP